MDDYLITNVPFEDRSGIGIIPDFDYATKFLLDFYDDVGKRLFEQQTKTAAAHIQWIVRRPEPDRKYHRFAPEPR